MATGNVRLFAVVDRQGLRPKVRHTVGFPAELTHGEDETEPLPWPDVLVIVEESQGNVFMYRLTRSGEPCGDTWHQSTDDARHQAEYEYGDALGEWRPVPSDASDPQEFAVAAVRTQEGGEL